MLPVERTMSTFLTAPVRSTEIFSTRMGSGLARNAPTAPGRKWGRVVLIFRPSRTSNRPSCKTAEMDVLEKGSDSESLSCAGSADGRSRPGARLSPVETNAGAAGAGVTAGVDCAGDGGTTAGFTGVISSVGFGGASCRRCGGATTGAGGSGNAIASATAGCSSGVLAIGGAVPEAGTGATDRPSVGALAIDSSATFGARAKGSEAFTSLTAGFSKLGLAAPVFDVSDGGGVRGGEWRVGS